MKLPNVLLLFTLGMVPMAWSQGLLYQVKQQPKTEQSVHDFLAESGCYSNYSFAVILPVGGCPRCEGAIPLFFSHAKKHFPDANRLLIAISNKTKIAQNELRKRDYGPDTTVLIKESSPFLDHFEFSTGYVGVPYLAIFENNSGRMVKAAATLGLQYSEAFFTTFTEELGSKQTTYAILGSDTVVSNVMQYAFTTDLSRLAIVDHISSSIILCERTVHDYTISEVISPSALEYSMYQAPDVPDELVLALKKMNLLNVLYLDVAFSDDGRQIIATASLPELYWENIETEDLAYKNKACIMVYDIEASVKAFIPIQADTMTTFDHTDLAYNDKGKTVIFPFKKGWPVIGTTAAPEKPEDDPEEASFYHHCPLVSEFDMRDGRWIKHHGTIPAKHQQMKTGYLYVSPLTRFTDDAMVIADCYIGEVFFFDNSSKALRTQYSLFDALPDTLTGKGSAPLRLEGSSSQLQQLLSIKRQLSVRLVDFLVEGDSLHAIVTDENHYYYCCWALPLATSGSLALERIQDLRVDKVTGNHARLFEENGKIHTIVIDDSEETLKVMVKEM